MMLLTGFTANVFAVKMLYLLCVLVLLCQFLTGNGVSAEGDNSGSGANEQLLPTSIVYLSSAVMGNPSPSKSGVPMPTSTEPTPTTTDLPTSPETETSTTEMGTSTSLSLSDIIVQLIIALAATVFIAFVVLLLIICITVYKCSRKSGKPRKQALYMVQVAEKGTSDLELETADLIESDSMIAGVKKSDEAMCETFPVHLATTEAEAAKENEQKSAQKEEREYVTLETFGLPPIATKELQGTASLDGGGQQLDTVKEQKGEEGECASEVATSRVEHSAQQKTTTTTGEHAADGEEQQSKPENADGKTNTVEEEAAQLTHEVATVPKINIDTATKMDATTKTDAATKTYAPTNADATTKIDAATSPVKADATKTDAATKIDAATGIGVTSKEQSTPASVNKDGDGVKGDALPSSEPPQKQEISSAAQDANKEKQGNVAGRLSGLDKEFADILKELEITDL